MARTAMRPQNSPNWGFYCAHAYATSVKGWVSEDLKLVGELIDQGIRALRSSTNGNEKITRSVSVENALR